jgi:inosine triphosphate pyrophosphatase
MKKILFITGNLNKLVEAKQLLPEFKIDNCSIKLPETQGSRKQIIINKASYALKVLKRPLIVEDTALCFTALNGLPGPYIKDFLLGVGNTSLHRMLKGFKDKRGKAVCSIGYIEPGKEPKIFEGITHGKIVKPKGRKDFGWSPIFKPNGSKMTYGEMTKIQKNKSSFRKKSFKKLHDYLLKNN